MSALPWGGLNWQAFPLLVAGLLAGWALLSAEGRSPGALGFYLAPSSPLEGILGMALGVAVGLAGILTLFGLGALRWLPEGGSLPAFFRQGAGSLWFFTIPAAAEEVLFRGYLLQALAEVWGGLRALVATSVAFGFIHLTNPNTTLIGIGNIVVAGLFLGAVYLKTASLWWATGAHLGWNWSLGFLADTPVSGLEVVDNPLHEGVARGAGWISGGSFGPEGSLVVTAILALAAVLTWTSPVLRPGHAAMKARPLILPDPQGGPDRGTGGHMDSNDSWRER